MLRDFDQDGPDTEPTYPALTAPRARVLVVDDDPEMRDVVAIKLRRDGYEVFEASSGDDALALLDAMHRDRWPTDDIDLLVIDIHMPGRSGVNVLRALRARHSTIPTLLMTGSPDPGLFTMAMCLGARVLTKPFSMERLSDTAINLILRREPSA